MSYPLAELPARVGTELFCSDWIPLNLEDEQAFASATLLREDFLGRPPSNGDPYGENLLSGFLLLSLLVAVHKRYLDVEADTAYGLNYGLEKVRFLHPVMAGQKVRIRAELLDVKERGPGRYRVLTRNVMEVEGSETPAMVADWLTLFVEPQESADE
ncbi:MaoC family dehydratase [Actinocorallia aurantiaca]|uniref:MaoC family dehydratase n=1 Tax=Actinocorallia aurantiaca TaxID=46204 RepID=A0ABP6GKM6_9ACTN